MRLLLLDLFLKCFFPFGNFVHYANHKGDGGFVVVGTSVVAELRGWEYDESANAIDDTILTDTWQTKQSGNRSWSGSTTCWWDETDTNGQETMTIGAKVTFKFYMEGTGTGSTYKVGTGLVTGLRQAAAINGIVEKTVNFVGDGALTQTTV